MSNLHVQSSSSCPTITSINVHHHIQSSLLSRNPQCGIVQSSSLCPIIMSIIMSNHHGQSSSSRNPHGGIVQCPMAVSHNFKFAHFRRCPLHLLRYTAEQNNTFENMYTIDDYNWVPSNSQLVEVLKLSLFSLSFTFNCNGEEDATLTNNENTVDKVPYHEKYLNLSAGPRWNSLHSRAQEKGRGVNKGERSPSLLCVFDTISIFR